MSEQTTYENNYPFSWLDDVIEITLNPEKSNLKQIKNEMLAEIQARLPGEAGNIIRSVKGQAFSLYSNDQVKVIAGHYDQSIQVLQRQAVYNQRHYPKKGTLFKTGQMILSMLDELSKNIHIRYGTYLPEINAGRSPGETKSDGLLKVLCTLSADQIGILLRAAFELKIILGPSFRKVCQFIAPFLSTQWKLDISWDTIRSSAGRPESRDKEIVVDTLFKLIEIIRGYR